MREERDAIEISSINTIQEMDENVIALVNREKIHKGEFEQIYEILKKAGAVKDSNEIKASVLKTLIERKVEEQKIMELDITASDEETKAVFEKAIGRVEGISFEEYVERNQNIDVKDMLNSIKSAVKHDKLYEQETMIGERDLGYQEIKSIKQAYLDTLVKEAEVAVQEEYFDLISESFEIKKLK